MYGLRELVNLQTISVGYHPMGTMPADGLTKSLGPTLFKLHQPRLLNFKTNQAQQDCVEIEVAVWKRLFEATKCSLTSYPGTIICIGVHWSGLVCTLEGECLRCRQKATCSNVSTDYACKPGITRG